MSEDNNTEEIRVLVHTADRGIEVNAGTPDRLFELAARGMYMIMCEIDQIKTTQEHDVEVSGNDTVELMVNWLSELLYLTDSKRILLSKFDVKYRSKNREHTLKAKVYGEDIDGSRQNLKGDVKAVTYHMMEVDTAKGYAKVLFDV